MGKIKEYHCTMEATLDLIGGKWKALILWHLLEKPLRFNELCREIPQVTPKILTQQLRDLEKNRLISRTVFPVVPPKVEYDLTPFGRSLLPILDAMCVWGRKYLEETGGADMAICPRTGKIRALPEDGNGFPV